MYLLEQSDQAEHGEAKQKSKRSAHVSHELRQVVAGHFLDFLQNRIFIRLIGYKVKSSIPITQPHRVHFGSVEDINLRCGDAYVVELPVQHVARVDYRVAGLRTPAINIVILIKPGEFRKMSFLPTPGDLVY